MALLSHWRIISRGAGQGQAACAPAKGPRLLRRHWGLRVHSGQIGPWWARGEAGVMGVTRTAKLAGILGLGLFRTCMKIGAREAKSAFCRATLSKAYRRPALCAPMAHEGRKRRGI